MQKKKILWLTRNLTKYDFVNAQAIAFKDAFSKLNITESSLENDDVLANALSFYDKFVSNFYNNILGYQNGLANKAITARELDCYFVTFGGELIPIGCFREQRPVEAVHVIEAYLTQCKDSASKEKQLLIENWQKAAGELSARQAQIKDSKNPSKLKAIVLVALTALNVVMALFALVSCFIGIDLPGKLIPIHALIITVIVLGFSVWPIICVIKEFKLLSQKETATSVINMLSNDVERTDAVLNQGIIKNYEMLCNACRRGENFAIGKNSNAQMIEKINSNIKAAYEYLKKTDTERTGIKAAVIILSAAIAVIIPLICFTPVVSSITDSSATEQTQDRNKKEDDEDEDEDDGEDDGGDEGENPPLEVNEIDTSVIDDLIVSASSYTEFGIYVKNLENGYEYGYDPNGNFLASAMSQIVILDALANVVDDHNIDIEETTFRFAYLESNGKEAPDSRLQNGTDITLKECIEDIAVYGDNNKTNNLVDYIAQKTGRNTGFDYINSFMVNSGYSGTRINRKIYTGTNTGLIDETVEANSTTPKEIANIFEHLIKSEILGSEAYLKGIFKSINGNGDAIGLKKFVSSEYDVCNVNAVTPSTTNNVALIEKDGKQLIVAILSSTQEDQIQTETDGERSEIQDKLVDYIIQTQFQD